MPVFPSALLTEWIDSPILLEKYYPLQVLPRAKIHRNTIYRFVHLYLCYTRVCRRYEHIGGEEKAPLEDISNTY